MYFNLDFTSKLQFSRVASEYDLARPSYPQQIYKDAQHVMRNGSSKGPLRHVLEIGSGSGQATQALENMADQLDCIEPGTDFANMLRKKFAASRGVAIYEKEFEKFETPSRYDLVVSACAIHWIPKDYFYGRIHSLLKPSGWFLGIWHLPHFSDSVNAAIAEIITPRFAEFRIPRYEPENQKLFEEGFGEFANERGFHNCRKNLYRSDRTLSSAICSALIWSYVNVADLSEAERSDLYQSLIARLDGLSPADLAVKDHFPIAMGQSIGAEARG